MERVCPVNELTHWGAKPMTMPANRPPPMDRNPPAMFRPMNWNTPKTIPMTTAIAPPSRHVFSTADIAVVTPVRSTVPWAWAAMGDTARATRKGTRVRPRVATRCLVKVFAAEVASRDLIFWLKIGSFRALLGVNCWARAYGSMHGCWPQVGVEITMLSGVLG